MIGVGSENNDDTTLTLNKNFSLTTFLSQILQLGIAGFLVFMLNIEAELGFVQFFPILILVFIVHSLTKQVYKPIVFLGSFVGTLYLFLGTYDASILLILGLLIFWVCHLPIHLNIRKLIVLGIGIVLALAKLGFFPFPLSSHGLTVIAAIFMFRVIVYLHELKHQKEPASIWHRLNYFFLLPNIIFPLFPIVDYQTYLKNYYNEKASIIYQRGINLIVWSLVCLLIYRWLYYFVVPDITKISGIGEVSIYIISTYLTVIRLVGIFSLSVGILRLFGYNLPDIFNYMFFASSFLDLFRRINIYWKNFLMKICFYPIFLKVRKFTPDYALPLAMLLTFFFTWVFHIYQWAWVLGTNPIRDTSLLFWGLFGILATINSIFEVKKKKTVKTLGAAIIHSSKVIGVFLTMAILYSMWTNSTFSKWVGIIEIGFQDDLKNWLIAIGIIASFIIVGGLLYFAYLNYILSSDRYKKWNADTSSVASYCTLGIIASLFFFSLNDTSNPKLTTYVNNFELNKNDASQEFDGYYEDILNSNISSKLWDDNIDQHLKTRNWNDLMIVQKAKSIFSNLKETSTQNQKTDKLQEKNKNLDYRLTKDILYKEYGPNLNTTFKGKRFSTNEWGLRDKSYSKIPPKNSIRIAIMGSSPVVGSGVHNEEVFEHIVEDRLNREYGNEARVFELLNFGRTGKYVCQQAYLLDNQVQSFQPDHVFLFDHFKIKARIFERFHKILNEGGSLYPELEVFLDENEIDPNDLPGQKALADKAKLLSKWSYLHFNNVAKKYDFSTSLVYFPSFVEFGNHYDELKPVVNSIGLNLIDMKNVFDGYGNRELFVSDHDRHPNDLAHKLIADQFYNEIVDFLKLEEDE